MATNKAASDRSRDRARTLRFQRLATGAVDRVVSVNATRIDKLVSRLAAPVPTNTLTTSMLDSADAELATLTHTYCNKSGAPCPALDAQMVRHLVNTIGRSATIQRLTTAREYAIHPLWLQTDARSLSQNLRADPAGSFVYLLGEVCIPACRSGSQASAIWQPQPEQRQAAIAYKHALWLRAQTMLASTPHVLLELNDSLRKLLAIAGSDALANMHDAQLTDDSITFTLLANHVADSGPVFSDIAIAFDEVLQLVRATLVRLAEQYYRKHPTSAARPRPMQNDALGMATMFHGSARMREAADPGMTPLPAAAKQPDPLAGVDDALANLDGLDFNGAAKRPLLGPNPPRKRAVAKRPNSSPILPDFRMPKPNQGALAPTTGKHGGLILFAQSAKEDS